MKNRDWKEVKLGELITEYGGVIQTGPFGSQLHEADYKDEGVPVVMPKDIIEGKIDETKISRIDNETFDRLKRHKLNIGDILLPRRGDFNKRAIITENESGWICGTGCLKISVSPNVLNPMFLFYYFTQKGVVEYVESQAVGTTMLNLSGSIVSKFTVPLPPLPIQQKIADTLGAYDELIENNRRRMALLENMAAGLYKEWFVRMRPHGLILPKNPETGLPEGWEVVNLKKISFANQKSVANFDDNAVISYVDISSVGKGIINDMTTYNFSDAPGRARRIVRHGDTIFSTVRPENKAYALILTPPENLIVSTGFIVLSPLKEHFTYFIYHLVSNESFIEEVSIKAKGSAYPQIGNDDFMEINFVLPTEKTLKQFHSFADPIFNQIKTLQEQTGVLRRMRDRLLPRLMSGELGSKVS